MPSGLNDSGNQGGWGGNGDAGGWGGGGYGYGDGNYGNAFGAGIGSTGASSYGGSGAQGSTNYGGDWGGNWGGSGSYGWGGAGDSSSGYDFGSGLGGMDFGSSYSAPSYSAPAFSSTAFSAPYSAPVTPAWTGVTGLTMPEASSTMGPAAAESSFLDNDFMKGLRKFGLAAAKQNPTANKAMGLAGLASDIGSGNYGNAIGTATSMATGNGLLGELGRIGVDHFSNPTRTYSEAGPDGENNVTVNADGRTAQTTGQRLAGTGLRTLGGLVGGATLGPFGALLGSEAMGRVAQNGPTGPTPATQAGMGREGSPSVPPQYLKGGMDGISPETQAVLDRVQQQVDQKDKTGNNWVGGLAGGLMGLYGLNQARGSAKDQLALQQQQQAQLQALQQQIQAPQQHIAPPRAPGVRQPNFAGIQQQLAGMFGPQSGVATELRSQLERKDAAAGRRSQYGPREVQLMAELTRLRAQAEPNYMNAEVGAANAANQAAMGIYGSQMNGYNSQMQDRQQNLQRMLAAQQLGMTNNSNMGTAQAAADKNRYQQLATLYSMGKDTGFFNWVGDQF